MPEYKNKLFSSEEDSALFKQSMQGVKPLSTDKRLPDAGKQKPQPVKKQFATERGTHSIAFEETLNIQSDDILFFAQQGLQNKTILLLKRGAIAVDDTVDLHGLTKQEAEQLLNEVLSFHIEEQSRCILVVHGKGKGSPNNRPVLKNLVFHLLKNDPAVLALASAQQRDGGTGAVYVLLNKRYSSGV
ncbi:MAG: hypothetical protein A6F72_01180 [Cycloclasticus sp. symbiont of Poecilosclerida sp. N]|nr:MAG: hypothetical protein A6F72_01180 [Cycloclasticus sp. symbiont of Poecilosclerida sp. N]